MIWKKKKFWGTLIAVALLAYCVKDISLADLRSLSERLQYFYLIPALVMSFAFVALKALRWRAIVRPQKVIPVWHTITLYSAGQVVNIVMPALTGQLGRIFLFSRVEGLRKTYVFSTIVLEIVLDAITLIAVLLVTSFAFKFPEEYRSAGYIIGIGTVAGIILLYTILLFHERFVAMSRRWLRPRWPGFYISLIKFLRSFAKGLLSLKSRQEAFNSLLYSFLYWIAHILVVYYLFRAFGFDLPLSAAAIVMLINTLALMVPITPGNAGTFEVAVSTSLAAFSIGRTDAVLFALALHLLDLLPLWVLGMWFLRFKKVSIKDIQRQHEDENILEHMDEDGYLIERERPA